MIQTEINLDTTSYDKSLLSVEQRTRQFGLRLTRVSRESERGFKIFSNALGVSASQLGEVGNAVQGLSSFISAGKIGIILGGIALGVAAMVSMITNAIQSSQEKINAYFEWLQNAQKNLNKHAERVKIGKETPQEFENRRMSVVKQQNRQFLDLAEKEQYTSEGKNEYFSKFLGSIRRHPWMTLGLGAIFDEEDTEVRQRSRRKWSINPKERELQLNEALRFSTSDKQLEQLKKMQELNNQIIDNMKMAPIRSPKYLPLVSSTSEEERGGMVINTEGGTVPKYNFNYTLQKDFINSQNPYGFKMPIVESDKEYQSNVLSMLDRIVRGVED